MDMNFINEANKLIENKNFSEAKIILEKNITEENKTPENIKLLGLCNVNLKLNSDALKNFQYVTEVKPDDATAWYYLATIYDNLNQLDNAEKAYLKVIELREEYIDAHKNLAILYIKKGKLEKTFEHAKIANNLDENDYQPYYILGTASMIAKDAENAVKYFEKSTEINTSNIVMLNSLGSAYFALTRFDDATKAFQKALLIDSKNPTSNYNLGNIAQIKKDYNSAFKYYQIAYNNNPSALYLTSLAHSALKAERFEDAVQLYKTLVVLSPEKQIFQYNLANAYLMVKDYKEAIALLKKLVMMNPQSEQMAIKLADAYIAIEDYETAKTVYDLLISKGKVSSELYYQYALICMKTNDIDKSEKIFKKVIQLDPKNAMAHKDLGVIYLTQRLFDYAKDEFETALKLDKNNPTITFEFANFLYATGDYLGAKTLYKKVVKNDSQNSQAYFYQGLNYLALNDLKNAEISFNNSVELEKNDINLYHLARVNYHLGNYDETLKNLQAQEIKDIDSQNLEALTYYEKGMYENSIEIYKKILEKFHKNLNIMLSLSKCYIKNGDKANAENAINSILKEFPEHEEALSLLNETKGMQ